MKTAPVYVVVTEEEVAWAGLSQSKALAAAKRIVQPFVPPGECGLIAPFRWYAEVRCYRGADCKVVAEFRYDSEKSV